MVTVCAKFPSGSVVTAIAGLGLVPFVASSHLVGCGGCDLVPFSGPVARRAGVIRIVAVPVGPAVAHSTELGCR